MILAFTVLGGKWYTEEKMKSLAGFAKETAQEATPKRQRPRGNAQEATDNRFRT